MPANTVIKLRRGSSSEWNAANPILASGEPGFDLSNNILKIGNGTDSWNSLSQVTPSGYALLNSPAFTGIPTAPTANSGTNTTQLATTAFVRTEIANLVDSAPNTLDTLNELANALGDDANFATTITNVLSGKANISGVVFTGPVVVPSGTGNFNSLQVNGTSVSLVGHSHTASQITDFNEAVDDRIGSGLFVAGTGINLNYNDTSNSFTVSVTGLINNPANNRLLTSRDGTSTGIDAESNLTFDGGNLIVGSSHTSSGSFSTIAGGGSNQNYGFYNFIGGGTSNTAGGLGFNVIVNGTTNVIPTGGTVFNFIGNGSNQTIRAGDRSFIGCGSSISISGGDNAIVGGGGHFASGTFNFIGGGVSNGINSSRSSIVGGTNNRISSTGSFIGGGINNIVSGFYSAVIGGSGNNDGGYNNVFILGSNITGTQSDTTYVNNLDVSTTGDIDTLKINKFYHNNLSVSSGISDNDLLITIVNPTGNATTQVIQGSVLRNSLLNQSAVLRFRQGTNAERLLITPSSGEPIWTTDTQKFYIGDGTTVGGDFIGPSVHDRGSDADSIVVLNPFCVVSGIRNSVLGGYNNTIQSGVSSSVVCGGSSNRIEANSFSSTICGGDTNAIFPNSAYASILGGRNIITSGDFTFVGGGSWHRCSGLESVIVGGRDNIILAGMTLSTIGGGIANTVSGLYSTIPGGAYAKTSLLGALAHAAGRFSQTGDAQHMMLVARKQMLTGTCTVSIASPALFSRSAHKLRPGDTVILKTTGFLPSGLAVDTPYYVLPSGFSNSGFRLSATLDGPAINTSGTQSGTHSVTTTSAALNLEELIDSKLIISGKTTWVFSIKLSAYNDTDNNAGWWIYRGGIKRDANNNTSLIGSLIIESNTDATFPSVPVSVSANDTNESLEIRVGGVPDKNIRWVAVVDINQVSYGTP